MDQQATAGSASTREVAPPCDIAQEQQPQSGADLREQLEAANMYVRESGLVPDPHARPNRPSVSNRSSLASAPTNDNNDPRSSSLEHMPDVDEGAGRESSDEEFILEFARQCSAFPGRKPLLLDIEQPLSKAQRPQLPMILVVSALRA